MPLNKRNTRVFHRTLFATELESVTLLKRDDDQREGVVTSYTLFQVRWSSIRKTGQQIQADETSDHRRQLHIPRVELERIGVHYINSLDRFVDEQNRTWEPESTTEIAIRLWENHVDVYCKRLN